MNTVFIIGGAGKVGLRLARMLSEKEFTVHALHRHPDQAQVIRQQGAQPVSGSLTELDTAALATLMKGCDVVVFSAGAGGKGGPEMTNAVDGEGLKTAAEAAALAGISRFLLVSAFPEASRDASNSPSFENYMRVKKQAEVMLVASLLDWVILRPGLLLDDQGSGYVRAGLAIPYGEVTRDNVAATLAEIIAQPRISRVIIELTDGEVPVREALEPMAGH
ncbi:NAD(P)H-binding protein [Pantoea allii]|uniref:NAD(P)H-binding protein n=1 Tax=Pantoea allii TaxID=574096 RepID=UPI0024B64C76|nr:NAD(P)H-binding protein [Pantoea allii]MDJ0042918.1 NAD(P)H-binding protein [Pantoea allii]